MNEGISFYVFMFVTLTFVLRAVAELTFNGKKWGIGVFIIMLLLQMLGFMWGITYLVTKIALLNKGLIVFFKEAQMYFGKEMAEVIIVLSPCALIGLFIWLFPNNWRMLVLPETMPEDSGRQRCLPGIATSWCRWACMPLTACLGFFAVSQGLHEQSDPFFASVALFAIPSVLSVGVIQVFLIS